MNGEKTNKEMCIVWVLSAIHKVEDSLVLLVTNVIGAKKDHYWLEPCPVIKSFIDKHWYKQWDYIKVWWFQTIYKSKFRSPINKNNSRYREKRWILPYRIKYI